jgi:hypothetical protein
MLDRDSDDDDLDDADDLCPLLPNVDLRDADEDGVGDPCDLDLDGDGVGNDDDNCRRTPNPTQQDLDNDGLGDACDAPVEADAGPMDFGVPDEDAAEVEDAGDPDAGSDGATVESDAADEDTAPDLAMVEADAAEPDAAVPDAEADAAPETDVEHVVDGPGAVLNDARVEADEGSGDAEPADPDAGEGPLEEPGQEGLHAGGQGCACRQSGDARGLLPLLPVVLLGLRRRRASVARR